MKYSIRDKNVAVWNSILKWIFMTQQCEGLPGCVTPHTLKYSLKKFDWYRCLSDKRTDTNVAKFSAVRLVKHDRKPQCQALGFSIVLDINEVVTYIDWVVPRMFSRATVCLFFFGRASLWRSKLGWWRWYSVLIPPGPCIRAWHKSGGRSSGSELRNSLIHNKLW